MNKFFYYIPRLLVAMIVSCVGGENFAQSPKFVTPMPPMKTTPDLTPIGESEAFTFVVFGDSQGDKGVIVKNKDGEETKVLVLDKINDGIVASRKTDKPVTFALSLGDLIYGEPNEDDIDKDRLTKDLKAARKKAAEFKIPVFNAPGNHELDETEPVFDKKILTGNELPSEPMREVYEDVIGQTYGSFDYGNSHFIILNTEDLPTTAAIETFIKSQAEHKKNFPKEHPGVDYHPQEFSFIGADQRAWLKADLDANTDKTHIFIAMHYPIYPKTDPKAGSKGFGFASQLDDDSRDYLLQLFGEDPRKPNYPNVAFVFASHQHLYYNHNEPDNIDSVKPYVAGKPGEQTRFIVSGGAGAGMHGSAKDGNFFHYLTVHVDGDSVTVEIVPTPEKP